MTKEEHDKIIDFVNSEDYMLLNSYISKPYEETIIEQDKEIERLNNIIKGQQIEIKKSWKEINKYKNIIDELEKEFEWQLKKQIDIDKFAEEQGFLNYNPVKLMVEHFKNKLKELKEGKE